MKRELSIKETIQRGANFFMPSVSLDCVIFGFHENELKVLLLKMKNADTWALPGGFIYKEEDIEDAAIRVLRERTGLHVTCRRRAKLEKFSCLCTDEYQENKKTRHY